MANIQLIQSKLSQELRQIASEYSISDSFLENKPELISMILKSKSMEAKKEKQSWFDLLPVMSPEQMEKLVDILTREQQKLVEIEKKYEQKKIDVINNYVQRFNESSYQNKIFQLKQNEAIHEQKDAEEADQLLNNL
ncbi:TPA: hypothetical protein DEP21_02745 [Patescibacteria group bacterium]|nr:hypothetical protein [Candidatus Gracilibacteria bacterium]